VNEDNLYEIVAIFYLKDEVYLKVMRKAIQLSENPQ